MATEEELGYRDAMHQVHRGLERRLNHLKDELKKDLPKEKTADIQSRMSEIKHIIEVIDSLHR